MSLDTTFLNQALEMSTGDRAELARRLLLSLEEKPLDDEVDVAEAWAAEIDARLDRHSRAPEASSDWRSAIDRVQRALKPGSEQ